MSCFYDIINKDYVSEQIAIKIFAIIMDFLAKIALLTKKYAKFMNIA